MTSRPGDLNEILDPGFVSRAIASSAADIRTSIKQCEAAEADLSYWRRLLQGRIDIVNAEADRRSGAVEGSLVDRLSSILGERDRGSRGGHVSVRDRPPSWTHPVERVLADAHLARLPELTGDELSRLIDDLKAAEIDISAQRRHVHQTIDALKAELVRRYREGTASASEVLPGRVPRPDDGGDRT